GAADRAIRVAATLLQQVGDDLGRTVADHARREELQRHLAEARDADWGERNVARPVAETRGFDWTALVENGFADLAWRDGVRAPLAPNASPTLTGLIARVAASGHKGEAAIGLCRIGDEIHMAAVAGLPQGGVLLFTRAIDERFLDTLSETPGLVDARLLGEDVPATADAMPLRAADGTSLGSIAWSLEQPGQAVFHKALLMILLATPAMIGLSWVFVRRARDATYLVIQRERALHREREQAQRYLTIAASIIVALDRGGRITLINDAGCRALRRGRESLIGRDWLEEAVPRTEHEWVRAVLDDVMRGAPDDGEQVEYEIVGAGQQRLISWRNIAIRNEDGAVDGILSSGDDITERRRIEARAREQEAELAHFLRLGTVGEMATGLAHEITQPLAAIKNFAQGCARRLRSGNANPEELLKAIEQVDHQATRAGDIIHRIRSFIRKREPEQKPFDINRSVSGVTEMLAHDMQRAGVEIALELDESLPPARADRVQIEQVIVNLARNGLDSLSAEDGESRRISITTERNSKGELLISIRDSGCGISAESLDKLFEPFYTTKAEGLGMGLSISRSIIEAHHGRLWAESVPGEGSVFRFTLSSANGDTDDTKEQIGDPLQA
ncbi:MAG: ATP-binding protein, partial [Alphaproteobacteria bacterium]|nr:ATP-binding protein [Alphaproteobacteria bacterium]